MLPKGPDVANLTFNLYLWKDKNSSYDDLSITRKNKNDSKEYRFTENRRFTNNGTMHYGLNLKLRGKKGKEMQWVKRERKKDKPKASEKNHLETEFFEGLPCETKLGTFLYIFYSPKKQ